jgi:hypothetical protein
MTIYIVTAGEYEDFGNCRVFSTLERAQEYIEWIKSHEKYRSYAPSPVRYEEWAVDEWTPEAKP